MLDLKSAVKVVILLRFPCHRTEYRPIIARLPSTLRLLDLNKKQTVILFLLFHSGLPLILAFFVTWMRIEARLVEKKGQEVRESPKDKRSRPKKHRRRQKKSKPSAVQQLFNTCKEVFADAAPGKVPPDTDIERLKSVLDALKPSDLGLKQGMPYFKSEKLNGTSMIPPVTYLHVYESEKFSIGIFCFPPSAVIPLHNHPGMTVFSKILFGSLHIKSYDWANVPCKTGDGGEGPVSGQSTLPTGIRLAQLITDAVFTAPCDTSILYPASGGNMHRFTGVTSCAVLDVLGPPYSDSEGRQCTYYQEFPYAKFSGEINSLSDDSNRYSWLKAKESPDDFAVAGAKYSGPRIEDNC